MPLYGREHARQPDPGTLRDRLVLCSQPAAQQSFSGSPSSASNGVSSALVSSSSGGGPSTATESAPVACLMSSQTSRTAGIDAGVVSSCSCPFSQTTL